MKQFVIAVFLSSLIISFSQAQRAGAHLTNSDGFIKFTRVLMILSGSSVFTAFGT